MQFFEPIVKLIVESIVSSIFGTTNQSEKITVVSNGNIVVSNGMYVVVNSSGGGSVSKKVVSDGNDVISNGMYVISTGE